MTVDTLGFLLLSEIMLNCCLVEKVSEATTALGRKVAPHIRRHSTKLLPTSLTQPTDTGGCSKFDDACDIAASGLKGPMLHI